MNIHGASERSNVMKVDGFDIGNAFTNQQWTTQFSTEVIQDVSIKTAGLDASTPLGRGGFLNIVTKSGGNAIHGSGAMFFQPRQWNGNNIPGGTPLDQAFYQPDVSLGGPVFKDRTWYFASYRRVYTNEGVPRTAAVLQSFEANGFEMPDYDKIFTQQPILRQGHPQRRHRPDADRLPIWTIAARRSTLTHAIRAPGRSTINIATGGPTAQVAWNAVIGSRLLLTAQYGYRKILSDIEAGRRREIPAYVRFAGRLSARACPWGSDTLLFYGNRAGLASWSAGVRDHHELTADASYLLRKWGGRHTLQTGMQVQAAKPRRLRHPLSCQWSGAHRGSARRPAGRVRRLRAIPPAHTGPRQSPGLQHLVRVASAVTCRTSGRRPTG